MAKVEPMKVFDIASESRKGVKYRVMLEAGGRWYCNCMSWVNNTEHRGEKDADGRAVPRTCKHTREAEALLAQKGARAYRTVQPVGAWYEELQEYVTGLVDYAKNGNMTPKKLVSFRADLDHFQEQRQNLADALGATDTFLKLYEDLLAQISEGI